MNVLSIGNSFSQDAQRYLAGIAKAAGYPLQCFNLYIGGCSLERHFRNMHSEEREYALEMNGVDTGFFVSIKEALLSRQWDVVTLQQASMQSVNYATYQPYLSELAAYVRKYQPKCRIFIHETWGYENGFERMTLQLGYACHADMYAAANAAYAKACEDISANGIIHAGRTVAAMVERGFENVHRDGFHLGRAAGRYAAALTWYKTLTGNSVSENSFSDFDTTLAPDTARAIRLLVDEVI